MNARATAATALAILLPMFGCSETDRTVDPLRYAQASSLLTVTTVSPTEFRAGETVRIDVVVRNPTNLPIVVHFTSGCTIMFAVRTPGDVPVAPSDGPCTANAPTYEIQPGEEWTRHFEWDGSSGFPAQPVAPGYYNVLGGFDPGVRRNASEPVAIRILTQ